MHFRLLILIVAFVGLFHFTSLQVCAQNSGSDQPLNIEFTVSMPQPHTHLLQVEMRVRAGGALPTQTDLVMPVWTPGSYLVREYARHVQDFAAKDGGGAELSWSKVDKDTWRINTAGKQDLTVTYLVYANELTVRTNELNDRHAFWNNAALLMYVNGRISAPSTLRVTPFGEWQVATGLPPVAGQPNTFHAENFDVLYDSPVEVAAFKTLTFDVRGIRHRIVIDGDGNYDSGIMQRDLQKIVEAAATLMGDVPYRDYTFILHLRPTGGGGLEHLNSTALIWQRYGFRPQSAYTNFLGLVAHEFFHLWNVKRIRPDALGPFDYTKENYTRSLWVAEGITSYYQDILLRRANLISDTDYLDGLAKSIAGLQATPGRRAMSVEEASFDAWIKFYRPDENAINSQVSYYDKGAIVGTLLDLEIRRRSSGRKSLDDAMRLLYTEYAQQGRNYTPEDFQRACEGAAGVSLNDFFTRYVRGRDELDYARAFEAVGLQLISTAGATGGNSAKNSSDKAYFGAALVQDGDRLIVRTVSADTPAYEQGLNAADQIVALDGLRVTRDSFAARLDERRPGDQVRLTIFRLDELRAFDIKLGRRPEDAYRIVPLTQPSAGQARLYQGWLGAPLTKATSGQPPTSRSHQMSSS